MSDCIATDARISSAFSTTLLLTAKATAALLGIDEKTLREMATRGVIGSVIVGASTTRYREADVRAFLDRTQEAPAAPAKSRRKASSGNSSSVVAFTDRPARLRDVAHRQTGKRPRSDRRL